MLSCLLYAHDLTKILKIHFPNSSNSVSHNHCLLNFSLLPCCYIHHVYNYIGTHKSCVHDNIYPHERERHTRFKKQDTGTHINDVKPDYQACFDETSLCEIELLLNIIVVYIRKHYRLSNNLFIWTLPKLRM